MLTFFCFLCQIIILRFIRFDICEQRFAQEQPASALRNSSTKKKKLRFCSHLLAFMSFKSHLILVEFQHNVQAVFQYNKCYCLLMLSSFTKEEKKLYNTNTMHYNSNSSEVMVYIQFIDQNDGMMHLVPCLFLTQSNRKASKHLEYIVHDGHITTFMLHCAFFIFGAQQPW